MSKIFVLDTNILLTDHLSPYNFGDNQVVLPLIVLEELDKIKQRGNEVSRDARAVIRTIDEIITSGEGKAKEKGGVTITGEMAQEGGVLRVVSEYGQYESLDYDINDNQIIGAALVLQEQYPDIKVILVTNDINMSIKADMVGVTHVEKYKSIIVERDIDYISSGQYKVEKDFLEVIPENEIKADGEYVSIHHKHWPQIEDTVVYGDDQCAIRNNWIFSSEGGWAAQVLNIKNDFIKMKMYNLTDLMKQRVCGIKPKNAFQAMCLHDLTNKDIDVNVMLGPAGSGKTILALAAACEMVMSKGKNGEPNPDEIIFSRTLDSQFEEIGFLPGTEHEKMAPWAGAVYDNLEVLSKDRKHQDCHPTKSVEGDNPFIKLKAPNFLRGRSFNSKVIIIDEAQNLSPSQMKTILTRVGQDCKIILMGNLTQIDNQFISANSSGLTHIANKFQTWKHATVTYLEGIVRSRTADFVENNF